MSEEYKGNDLKNVTEEHRRGMEISRLAHVNRRILDAIPHSILLLDDKLNIMDANRHYIERRKDVANFLGKNIKEVFPRHLLEEGGLEAALLECLDKGAPKLLSEVPHFAEEHEPRWLNMRIYPIEKPEHTEDEPRSRIILMIDDVTAYINMREQYQSINEILTNSNKELQQTMEQLQTTQSELLRTEKLASVGQLAAGVAHEINNPVAYVLSNLKTLYQYQESISAMIHNYRKLIRKHNDEALISEMEEAERKLEIDYILQDSASIVEENVAGASRIRDIVRDLSTFSRADVDMMGPVNVNRVIESAIKMSFNEIKHRAMLKKDLGNIPDIYANAGQLGQVFLNLILNAAHAIQEGHAESNVIRVESRQKGDSIVVSIQDTGRGIPGKNIAKIFDPFFTTKAVGEGAGLGLAICLNLVRRHGGDIQVESKQGEGSTFEVILPLETGLDPAVKALRDAPLPEKPSAGEKPRVLLIDDDVNIIKSYSRLFKPYCELVAAPGGQKGMETLAEDHEFDVILCDLMMPDIDGIEVYDYIRENFPFLIERIIFFTGGAFTPRAIKFIDSVANLVLEKPVNFPELLLSIRKLIDSRKQRDE